MLPETESKALLLFQDEAGVHLWLRFISINGYIIWINEATKKMATPDEVNIFERRLEVVRQGETRMKHSVLSKGKYK